MPTPHEQISSEIEKIVGTKNPFSILFSLGRVAETLARVDDELIDGIERTFVDSTGDDYKKVLAGYKKEGFFTYLSSWAIGSGKVKGYRRELDRYFDASFAFDLDFFFRCLRQDRAWGAAMILLVKFAKDAKLRDEYFAAPAETRHSWICDHYTPARDLPEGARREACVVLNNLANEPFPPETVDAAALREQDEDDCVLLARETALRCFRENPAGKRSKYFMDLARRASVPGHRLIEAISDESVLKLLTYLRRASKVIAAQEGRQYWRNDAKVNGFVGHARRCSFAKDCRPAVAIEGHVRKYRVNREYFYARLRYRYLAKFHPALLDMVFGVPDLPREEWSMLKRKTGDAPESEFGVLRKVQDLALYLQDHLLTEMALPFFLRRLATRFNSANSNYWLVKFVLLMVLPKSYSEYRKAQSFYCKLEANWAPGFRGSVLRAAQFGWAWAALAVAAAVFPMGVLAAAGVWAVAGGAERAVRKWWPALAENLNFQARAGAAGLAAFALCMGATVGLGDNLSLAYSRFQSAVNAVTLPASETLALLDSALRNLAADITSAGSEGEGVRARILDVDYVHGRTLASADGTPQTGAVSATGTCVPEKKSPQPAAAAGTFVVKPGSTFWDNAVRLGRACGADVSPKAGERSAYLALDRYLNANRARLTELSRAAKSARLPAMELVRYLPAGTVWDEAGLAKEICGK